ncbi:MAG: protein kinase domain-containing protein [Polyangiales bacterium]
MGEILAGKYRVERVLGRGGMGLVVEAVHLQLEQPVAIKFLLPEATSIQGASARFLREARAAARIKSEHVARVLDVDQLPSGEPYMVMEYLVGTDLHRLVREQGPLSVQTAIDYVLQACEALAEAHAMGIVHRDLKPSNLFLTHRPDGAALVKLLDFGIAKAPTSWSQPELTRGLLGSPLYMSPEQLRDSRSVDARADIWALGVILHELLTGRFPFEAPSEAALGAMVATNPPASLREHFSSAPEGLEKVILRCLEKDPQKRFDDVGALATALRAFAGDRSQISVQRIASMSLVSSASPTVLAPTPAPPASGPVSESRVRSTARAATDNFRRQHEELANLGAEIFGMIGDVDGVAKNAANVRRSVARFAGKLKMHAAMENEALYPRLLQHRDPAVRAKAKALFDEVEQIYATFGAFAAKWPTIDAIVADPAAYAKDTRRALKTLWVRMMRENDELYPMVDAAEEVVFKTA